MTVVQSGSQIQRRVRYLLTELQLNFLCRESLNLGTSKIRTR